eukprot:gene36439-44945_t
MFACALTPARASDETVEITRATIEAAEEGYRLSAAYSFELNHGLEDALQFGVTLYFTTEVEFTRPRWYWMDEKAVKVKRTFSINYNVLTRQYHVGPVSGVRQSFSTLEDALFLLRRPSRWWRGTDLIVVLGGPIGVNDTALYPWLAGEIRGLKQRLELGLPTLGICLGAQLMAAALGGRIERREGSSGAPQAEIGWSPLYHADMPQEVDADMWRTVLS